MPTFRPRCKLRLTVLIDPRGRKIDLKRDRFTVDVQPRTCSVSRNGYHEAATWNAEFDSRLLPFDPDQIKQTEARVYMWDAKGDEPRDFNWGVDRYEMIRGLADDVEGSMVGEDNSIKLSGRDYTGVLIDVAWDPKVTIPVGLPLDVVIEFIANIAAPPGTGAAFVVANRTNPQREMPIVGGTLGKKRSTKAKGEWVKPGKNHWDIIYDVAIASGFIAYVTCLSYDGGPLQPTIVLTNAQTQTKQVANRQAPRLAYGRHLTKLSVKRKFGREKTPQQICRFYDPLKKQEVEIVYPEKRNELVTVFDTVIAVDKDEQEFVLPRDGIFDRDLILEYLKTLFYYRGRAETTYSFETAHLFISQKEEQDIGVDAQGDFDLLRLQHGSTVGVKFDPFNREHLRAITVGERAQHIMSLGYRTEVANLIANNLDVLTEFEQPYHFHKGQYDFDIDEGLTIKIDGVNFASAIREEDLARQSDQSAGQAS